MKIKEVERVIYIKVLIILNYQREIPPFLITQVHIAEKYFNEIVYVTPTFRNDNSRSIQSKKTTIVQISKLDRLLSIVKTPLLFLNKEVLNECFQSFRKKKMSISYLKHLAFEIVPADMMSRVAKRFVNNNNDNEYFVMSAWFNASAYAAAKLKQKKIVLFTMSWAHAFEIDPERNNYVGLSLDSYKHYYLNKIVFISQIMKNKYLSKLKENNGKVNSEKTEVLYLGSEKKDKGTVNKVTSLDDSECFHLASCSGVNEIKRIDLILQALSKWNKKRIKWTHLGGGPLLDDMLKEAEKINSINSNVIIEFRGKMSNEQVHAFYSNTYVDLFINTSRLEGLPISIMEAMSYGIPVVATNVGGTSEIVNDRNGFLLDPNPTSVEICKALEQYYDLPKKDQIRYRNEALLQWESHFNAEKNLNDFFLKMVRKDRL